MIVGDSGVGKTSMINTLKQDGSSNNTPDPTNSVDINFKKMKIKDSTILINVNRLINLVKYMGLLWQIKRI
jgi:hypothetical protein